VSRKKKHKAKPAAPAPSGGLQMKPIAPKPSAPLDTSFDASGDGYRAASRAEKPLRPPSDIPAAAVPVWRTRVLIVAVWTVLVFRFAVSIRAHGLTGKALLMGTLSSLAILPIVIGAILLLVPNR
jgi:hypothetical protein